MSRPQLSAEQRKRIFINYIYAAREIMKDSGMEGLTLRRVSTEAGYNSATLYHYFRDLDELATFAVLSFLREWEREMAHCIQGVGDPTALLYSIWENFCNMSFEHPRVLHTLFFGKYSGELDDIIARYVAVLPEEGEDLAGEVMIGRLFSQGPILQRSMTVLRPLSESGLLPVDKLDRCNEVIVYCFKELLEEKISMGDALDCAALTARQLGYIRLLLGT